MELDEQMLTGSKRGQQRLSDTEVGGSDHQGASWPGVKPFPPFCPQESMQGSSDETANSVEEGSSGPGSSSGHSDVSSNEAPSSRASQSAGSPGSEMHSDDMVDSEALKEDDEDEEEEEEDDDDEDEDEDKGERSTADSGQQKESREQPESRKRKAGEALCEGSSQGAGPSCAGAKDNPKVLSFSPETSAAMATAASTSLEGRMRLLDACSASSSARPDEAASPQQPSNIGSAQMVQGAQEPPCLSRPGDFLGEAMGSELFTCRRFIGPQHHHHPHHDG